MLTLPTKKVQDIIFSALSLTNDGVAVFDANDTVIYCNESMAKLFDSTAAQALNKTFGELIKQCFNRSAGINIEADNVEKWLATAADKRRSVPFRSFETDTQDGRWYLITEQVVSGDILYFSSTDITEKKQAEMQLEALSKELHKRASTDELTTISNRHNFYEMAEIEFHNAQIGHQPLTLILIDIDNFKSINDNFGHAAGDTALKEFAHNIKGKLRKRDLFARIGGDEFSIILPNTDTKQSLIIAERFRNTIAKMKIHHKDQTLQLTASIGIVQASLTMESIHDVINAADKALYQAKSEGRNKVCNASEMCNSPINQYQLTTTRISPETKQQVTPCEHA
ncbi:sensor domain-containing diguanylate cyclase [Moritella sp. Urea-trap-13]|uniref:sensor domain-containing diguanylate cyclase n=1 Tax=Moritella sp. Urea-trap-13 TaxID=2058327 RepID=UPI000C323494|nr:sensor domain-containing diguanylate cyclase [Moritella sp. Urea-trap-13]PKH07020.1 PAS domain S-box protein [Moritella sp. Urea-trap-13]